MKIAITSDSYYPMANGVASLSHNLAKTLSKAGHEVIVLAPSTKKKSHIETEPETGFKIYRLRSSSFHLLPDQIHKEPAPKSTQLIKLPRFYYKHGWNFSLLAYRELKKHLDEFKPDVIHSHTPLFIGWASLTYAKNSHVAFISTGHCYPDNFTANMHIPRLIKKPVDVATREYMASIMRPADYATFPSKTALKELLPRNRKVKTAVVPNGVDLSNFSPAKVPDSVYTKYKLPKDTPIVAFIGRIDKEKSIDVLIDAFAEVVKTTPAHLLIVGDGIQLPKLEQQAKKLHILDKTTFTGRQTGKNLLDLYRICTIYATASLSENHSVAIIEALACAKPIVAVDYSPMTELVLRGKNGLVSPEGDTLKMAKNIVNLLTDKKLYNKLSAGAIASSKNFDIASTIKRYEDVYKKAIKIRQAKKPKRILRLLKPTKKS